jgi:hypothetical protein
MRLERLGYCLFLALAVLSAAGQTLAGSLVEFANVLEQARPTRLSGYLSLPDGAGPFPAGLCCMGAAAFRATRSASPMS